MKVVGDGLAEQIEGGRGCFVDLGFVVAKGAYDDGVRGKRDI